MIPPKYWSPTKKLMVLGAMAGGKLVEATALGNPLTFITDKAKPLKSLLIPFTPQQSGTGDPSPQNIRSILPWNGLKVWNAGKNLFNGTNVINGYFAAQGSDTIIYSASAGRTVWCPCKPDTVYAISKMTGGKRLGVYVSEEEPKVNTVVCSTQRISGSGTDVYVFRTPSNAKYICAFVWFSTADTEITAEEMLASVQIEVGETATAYTPFVPITETSIPFASPVYGGTLDVVSGVLTVEFVGKSATWGELNKSAPNQETGYIRGHMPFDDAIVMAGQGASAQNSFCNIGKYSWDTTSLGVPHFYPGTVGGVQGALVYLHESTSDDTVIQAVCKLATPVEIQLTPEQITALVGDNTIWSDADGQMTAVYLKKG